MSATPIPGYDQWKTTAPDYDEGPCQCCGKLIDDCICPECPVCSEYGDPNCYKEHGLKYSAEQVEGIVAVNDAEWKFSQDESCSYLTTIIRDLVTAIPIFLEKTRYENGDDYDKYELERAEQSLQTARDIVKPHPIPENQKLINILSEINCTSSPSHEEKPNESSMQ